MTLYRNLQHIYQIHHITRYHARTGHLTDGNFITCLLYKECY